MKKKGIIYRRMLLSFLAAFILPICISVVFYFFSRNIIVAQVERSSANLLQTVQGVCDEEFETFQSALQQYTADELIRQLGTLDATDGTEYTQYNELWKKLRDSSLLMDYTATVGKDMFLYFPKIDRIISVQYHILRPDNYMKEICQDAQTKDAVREFLLGVEDEAAMTMDIQDWGDNIVLLTMRCWRNIPACDAVVGVFLDVNTMKDKVADVDWQYGFEWAILDQNDAVIKSAESIPDRDILAYVQEPGNTGAYITSSLYSPVSTWRYVLCVPDETVEDAAAPLRLFFTLTLLLCVCTGVLLTVKLTNVNYRPIAKTMKLVQSKGGGKQGSAPQNYDEYQYIRQQVEKLMDSKQKLEHTLFVGKKNEKNWVLTNLLMKPEAVTEDKYRELIAPFAVGRNRVALIREMVFDGGTASILDEPMKRFVVENVLTEMVSQRYHCQMANMDGFQAMIIHAGDRHESREVLQGILQEFQTFLTEQFQYSVTVAMGGAHEGLKGISTSYLEARETEEFLAVLEQDYIEFEEIRDKTLRKYSYSMQAEEMVYMAIQNDNPELAAAFIGRAVDEAFASEAGGSFHINRVMLADIYCTLLKAADEKGSLDKVCLSIADIEAQTNLDALKDCFAQIVNSICQSGKPEEEVSANAELCRKIIGFIRENYGDADLNVSKVALAFHLSPSALSSIYKKETGSSVLKVLNETRIENAAILLKKGCSVADTAKKVGIIDSSSFIRLFKKHVGITPGQYKANFTGER